MQKVGVVLSILFLFIFSGCHQKCCIPTTCKCKSYTNIDNKEVVKKNQTYLVHPSNP